MPNKKNMLNLKQEASAESLLTVAHCTFERALKTHAFFKLRDRSLGEDLVQDTFMKTWSYLMKGGKIDMMKAFLYHVLNNLIIDEYRKNKAVSLDLLVEKGFEPKIANPDKLFDILDGKAATLLIQRLPATYQKVMRMRYVQDLSIKEISMITGQSRNSVAVQAHRGLEKLKLLYNRE